MSPKFESQSISMPSILLRPLATLLVVAAASAMSSSAWTFEAGPQALKHGHSRVAPSGEWIVAPGESPASLAQLLYPQQPGVQRRFITALADANPALGIDSAGSQPLPVGELLKMPDWRLLGTQTGGIRGETRVAPAGSPGRLSGREQVPTIRTASQILSIPDGRHTGAPDVSPRLRLSMNLAVGADASDQLRQILRLEYRLLITLHEQLSALAMPSLAPTSPDVQIATSLAPPPLATATAAAAPVPATSTESGSENPPAPVSPLAPVKIREVPAPAPVVESASDASDWLYPAGLGAAVLVLIWLVLRRRHTVVGEQKDFEMAQTVLLEHPAPAASAAAFPGNDKPARPSPAAKAPAVPPIPAEPDMADANPVMELAEIMLSFGRIQGAAQTLQEYIEANPKETLQPWVKLLDIYRAGDMHAEFDELAEKLNKNFNVEVQHWVAPPAAAAVPDESLPKALTLEELPHICPRLIAQWGQPECLEYLHQLLRDNRGGQRSGFTLPVVQEILLLIDILVAREAA